MKNKHLNSFSLFCLLIISSLFLSCSLKYDQSVNAEETNPEFVFKHAKMIRYKNAEESTVVHAESIEQYKNSDITYGKNVSFTTYDDEHKVETEGSCGYLYADTKSEVYELFDGIKIANNPQNTNFSANMLKWNGKTEQLTGGKRDTAKIEKDGTVIYGTGFSASGVSKTFSFSGTVSGEIEAKDKE
ncbi:MAG: LPS export ABC transporter periplasmic protein LptC [Treponema sp.]|nr:LPS export ABC transporter periplasmic protein LptC [Treponema sp.]